MTPREKIWFDEFLKCWDATEAARRVPYKWPNKLGPRLKKKFEKEISDYLKEHHMTADEVLKLLSDQARGNIARYAHIESTGDLIEMNGDAAVIKKFKRRVYQPKNGEPYEEIEIEMYDAQGALDKMARHHSLYNDKVEHTGSEGGPIQWQQVIIEKPTDD